MTEPMKGLAEYLRQQAMQRDAMLGKPYPSAIDNLRQWAAEVEASRLPLAGAAPSDALMELRHAVRTAWMTGVPNFREFYDEALYAVLGITCLQDLYRESEPLKAVAATKQQPDAQLCKFYAVSTFPELVAAMLHHIERLQAKLPATPSFAPQRVREG